MAGGAKKNETAAPDLATIRERSLSLLPVLGVVVAGCFLRALLEALLAL